MGAPIIRPSRAVGPRAKIPLPTIAAARTPAKVPGAFEIPLVARRLASSGGYDALICLGAVVRGETAHFDLVAGEAARGIADVSRTTGIPVVFEVLATESLADAEARAGGPRGNKGWDAAEAALEMADLLDRLPGANEREQREGSTR